MIILGMFFIAPYQVQAEESKEKTGGILSETTGPIIRNNREPSKNGANNNSGCREGYSCLKIGY